MRATIGRPSRRLPCEFTQAGEMKHAADTSNAMDFLTCDIQTLKIAPILRPSNALAERIVSVSSTIAHTPSALAM